MYGEQRLTPMIKFPFIQGFQYSIWEWYHYLLLKLSNVSYDDYNCPKFWLFGLKAFCGWFTSILYLFSAILRNKDREKVPFCRLKIRVNKCSLIWHSYALWKGIGIHHRNSLTVKDMLILFLRHLVYIDPWRILICISTSLLLLINSNCKSWCVRACVSLTQFLGVTRPCMKCLGRVVLL